MSMIAPSASRADAASRPRPARLGPAARPERRCRRALRLPSAVCAARAPRPRPGCGRRCAPRARGASAADIRPATSSSRRGFGGNRRPARRTPRRRGRGGAPSSAPARAAASGRRRMTPEQLEVERRVDVEAEASLAPAAPRPVTPAALSQRGSPLSAGRSGTAASSRRVPDRDDVGRVAVVRAARALAGGGHREQVAKSPVRASGIEPEPSTTSPVPASSAAASGRRRAPNDRPSGRPRVDPDVVRPADREPRGEIVRGERPRPGDEPRQLARILGGLRVQDSNGGTRHAATLAAASEVALAAVRAYIGLGANVGDARGTLTEPSPGWRACPARASAASRRLYRTAPVGVTDQPDFLNAVVALDVPGGPRRRPTGAIDLLVALKDIERAFGRQRRKRWGPRELDLDLLLFGPDTDHRRPAARGPPLSAIFDPAAAGRLLEVPHPSMRDRLFVLAPLADLAPDLVPPGWDETVGLGPPTQGRDRRARGGQRMSAPGATRERTWVGPSGGADRRSSSRPVAGRRRGRAGPHGLRRGRLSRHRRRRIRTASPAARRCGTTILAEPAEPVVRRPRRRPDRRASSNIGAVPRRARSAPVRVLYVPPAWWGSGAGQLLMERAHAELAADHDEAMPHRPRPPTPGPAASTSATAGLDARPSSSRTSGTARPGHPLPPFAAAAPHIGGPSSGGPSGGAEPGSGPPRPRCPCAARRGRRAGPAARRRPRPSGGPRTGSRRCRRPRSRPAASRRRRAPRTAAVAATRCRSAGRSCPAGTSGRP